MTYRHFPFSRPSFYLHFGMAKALLPINVRRAQPLMMMRIIGAARRPPDDLANWSNAVRVTRSIIMTLP